MEGVQEEHGRPKRNRSKENISKLRGGIQTSEGRVVYVASPLRGDIEGNLKKATSYCAFVTMTGATPIAPHLYFASFLDDTIEEDRTQGMAMGIELLKRCDELWVFGEPSEGMKAEIEIAKELGITTKHINREVIKGIFKGGSKI